jgi:hypothetical protein
MDFVVVTHAPDIKLLRHFLKSYETYYGSKDKIHIFTSIQDLDIIGDIGLPSNASLVYREEYEGVPEATPFSQQLFLKIMAHTVATTEYFCIMDSDFLFIQPTSDADFFHEGRPVWFYRPWVDGEPPLRWRAGSEDFVQSEIADNYACIAQYVFKRSVAADLTTRYGPTKILNSDKISEFLVYAWFAHRWHPDEYLFVPDTGVVRPVVRVVNQIPPTYCHLDPSSRYEQFKSSKCVAFWSHWDLAEAKMIEFFEDSQRDNFGEVRVRADRRPLYRTLVTDALGEANVGQVDGAFADGWVNDVIHFGMDIPSAATALRFELDVPGNPLDRDWRLAVTASLVSFGKDMAVDLEPGPQQLVLPVPSEALGQRCVVELAFGPGFRDPGNADQREFRARLRRVHVGRSIDPGASVGK